MAAPTATTSSGFTPLWGSLLKSFFTVSTTSGMRVMPPTRMTSFTFSAVSSESFMHCFTGPSVFSMRSPTSCSSLLRVSAMTRCFGPDWSAVMNGRFTSVCIVVDSSIFAFSAASLRRWRA